MKRLTILVAALLLATAPTLTAAPVDSVRAARVARAFWEQTLGGRQAALLADRTAEWPFDGIRLFVHPAGGYVMVASDDAARPILGYSLTAPLEPARLPVSLAEWLEGYRQQLDWLREHGGQASAADAAMWRSLDAGLPLKGGEGVDPLLTTHWDQQEPYNDLCPEGTVTGCAATAQTQMMKYWNHPAFGTGSHAYTAPDYGVQSADFAHTLYDWAHMPDAPTALSAQQERLAVATLMYHVGVSLDMVYRQAGQGGSSAAGLAGYPGVRSIDNSLKDHFRYNPAMRVVNKDQGYTDASWRAAIIAELDQRRPVVYVGAALAGGHGFVCDGYDGREYLHFNFGWSGVGDGYFPVDSISPGIGGVGGNGSYTFNMSNSALLEAYPVRGLCLSDTLVSFTRDGGVDSLLFAADDTLAAPVTATCDAAWITLLAPPQGQSGWVRLQAEPFAGTAERSAVITFRQGDEVCRLHVVQQPFADEELCPLTVVMRSTQYDGWQNDARLTLESAGGYVFGTARLEAGWLDSVVIRVAPHDVRSVWHRGGGTDRYIDYWVKNPYGEVLVEAVYAFSTGGTHLLEWPCARVGVEECREAGGEWRVWPNPVVDELHVEAEGLRRVELMDAAGRRLAVADGAADGCRLSMAGWPAGVYFVRLVGEEGVSVRRVVKR